MPRTEELWNEALNLVWGNFVPEIELPFVERGKVPLGLLLFRGKIEYPFILLFFSGIAKVRFLRNHNV